MSLWIYLGVLLVACVVAVRLLIALAGWEYPLCGALNDRRAMLCRECGLVEPGSRLESQVRRLPSVRLTSTPDYPAFRVTYVSAREPRTRPRPEVATATSSGGSGDAEADDEPARACDGWFVRGVDGDHVAWDEKGAAIR